jgi:putative ABC transport system permease protein
VNIFQLAWKNVRYRALSSVLSILLLSLGLGLYSMIYHVQKEMQARFYANMEGIDMVVGSKDAAPQSLILSAVFQTGNPSPGIPLSEYQSIAKHPLVAQALPLAYGDSYKGVRILCTQASYLEFFETSFSKGKFWAESMEVVLGAQAAKDLQLKVGDEFYGNHGLDAGHAHDERPFKVVGVLEKSGAVLDRLILSSLESIWDLHAEENEEDHDHDENQEADHELEEDKDLEITAILLQFRSPLGLVSMPNYIQSRAQLGAALPVYEINQLLDSLGIGFQALRIISIVILLVASISIFISLLSTLSQRQSELALMRSLGASPSKLFGLLLMEAILLALFAIVLGLLLSRIGVWFSAQALSDSYSYGFEAWKFDWMDLWAVLVLVVLAVISAFIPAWRASKTQVGILFSED